MACEPGLFDTVLFPRIRGAGAACFPLYVCLVFCRVWLLQGLAVEIPRHGCEVANRMLKACHMCRQCSLSKRFPQRL